MSYDCIPALVCLLSVGGHACSIFHLSLKQVSIILRTGKENYDETLVKPLKRSFYFIAKKLRNDVAYLGEFRGGGIQ